MYQWSLCGLLLSGDSSWVQQCIDGWRSALKDVDHSTLHDGRQTRCTRFGVLVCTDLKQCLLMSCGPIFEDLYIPTRSMCLSVGFEDFCVRAHQWYDAVILVFFSAVTPGVAVSHKGEHSEIIATSFFYRPSDLPVTQPMMSKNWRELEMLASSNHPLESHPLDLILSGASDWLLMVSVLHHLCWLSDASTLTRNSLWLVNKSVSKTEIPPYGAQFRLPTEPRRKICFPVVIFISWK